MILLSVGRIAQREHAAIVLYAHVLVDIEYQVYHLGYLGLDLLGRHEEVRVVLAEMPCALDALKRSARLESEVVSDLTDPDGKFPVAVRPVSIYHHVVRAVHGTKHECLILHLHRREHIFLVVIPVAAGLVKIDRADAGRHNVIITELKLLVADVVLKLAPDGVALREEHGKTLADEVVAHEQAHLLADLSVIAGPCLLLLLLVLVELLL